MIYDNDFLLQLDESINKVVYAKIISLTWDELPIETIEGKVTSGSINIDGSSALRRTCSLSLIAKDLDIQEYYWGERSKFSLEIGIENTINPKYPEIIWFKQGIYVTTSFNTSLSLNGYTVSIQGKDKMCLLNGEVGGSLAASIDFGTLREVDKNNITHITYLPIKEIIKQAVHVYGNEYFHNIIINDLDGDGLELLEYRLDTPMFLLRKEGSNLFTNSTFDVTMPCWYEDSDGKPHKTSLGDINNPDEFYYNHELNYDPLIDSFTDTNINRTRISLNFTDEGEPDINNPDFMYAAFIKYGDTPGYRIIDLTYGEMILSIGDSVTSVLDKIVAKFSNFEYFYNLDGQFVFQQKKNGVNTPFNTTEDQQTYIDNTIDPYYYYFKGSNLIISFNNSPNLSNIKNDFSVWGVRQGSSGAELPIHMRYAIDTKPWCYTTIDGITYTTLQEGELIYNKEDLNLDFATNGYLRKNIHPILGEKWWEVREWADAWNWIGLPVPDKTLGTYCVKQAIVYKEGTTNHPTSEEFDLIEISAEDWEALGITSNYLQTEDIIFKEDGKYWSNHGKCTHTYTQWLDYFLPSGRYKGGSAYFYNPKVPAEAIPDPDLPQEIIIKYDTEWREIIYQMAKDYFRYAHEIDDFELRIIKNNKPWHLYNLGKTGYEQYYTDIVGFWRQLYNPDVFEIEYPSGILAIDELSQFTLGEPSNHSELPFIENPFNYNDPADYPLSQDVNNQKKWYWCKDVTDNPAALNFWFDFLDADGSDLAKYSNKTLGNRLKAVNDNNIKGIYFKDIPSIIFMTYDEYVKSDKRQTGYRYFIAPKIDNMFTRKAQGKSAKSKVDELLYAHSYLNESVTIQTIPIYYLQPSNIIHVTDIETNINGDYIINKISLPLGHDKTMSITASKVVMNLL